MRHASLPEDAKHQITLPKEHHVTNLIVQHYHFASGHSGGEYVLSLQRSKFWVIRANSVVHKLLTNCFSCRGWQAPVCSQKMADLSKERVTRGQPPFSHVGIDFFGPFMVKSSEEVRLYRELGRLEPGFLHLSLVLNHYTKGAIGTNSSRHFIIFLWSFN